MEQQASPQAAAIPNPIRSWGLWSVIIGAVALTLVFVQLVGPTFETKPSVATQIGEIAGEMKRSAWRTFFGIPPAAPEAKPVPIWNYFALAAPIMGIIAIVLAVVSRVRHENRQYMIYGVSFGVSAMVFQYIWWMALLICGVILLVAIIQNLGDFFSW